MLNALKLGIGKVPEHVVDIRIAGRVSNTAIFMRIC